jgi:hypothetical protein
MDNLLIGVVVLMGSALTLFSGFGLGTLLMPVMAIFFPLELAILLTAIVHLFNNLFKLSFFYRHIDWKIILRFAPTAIIGAWLGSMLLDQIADLNHDIIVPFTKTTTNITNITIGCLLLFFALMEWTPENVRPAFDKKWLPLGGALSGFFGGLSGHQGALRTAFLVKTNLSKDALIATGIIIATFIDVSRLSNYAANLNVQALKQNGALLTFAIVCSSMGVILGKKLLGSVTLPLLQKIIAISLITFSMCLIIGWL